MVEMNDRYDSALLGILQHEGKIENFLHAVFGFLYRRTDFYRIMKTKEDKMGFPQGVALKILLNVYKIFEDLAVKDEEFRQAESQKLTNKSTEKSAASGTDKTKENKTQCVTEKVSTQKESKSHETKPANQGHQSNMSENQEKSKNSAKSEMKDNKTDTSQVKKDNNDVNATKDSESKSTRDEDENPELARQQEMYQSNPESYNGAIRDQYSWSQTITDVDIQVKVPSYITKGRDVNVVIEKKHIIVKHKTDKGSWEECVNGDLMWEVNKEESMWNLIPGDHILINLEKRQERWWESILTSEPKINVRKIDASRPMSDLDDEAQAKIEEMMYNERQKRLGLPTSEEKKMHNMLKGAWDAEGSPFKGQPFDPSKLNINQGGVITMDPNS